MQCAQATGNMLLFVWLNTSSYVCTYCERPYLISVLYTLDKDRLNWKAEPASNPLCVKFYNFGNQLNDSKNF